MALLPALKLEPWAVRLLAWPAPVAMMVRLLPAAKLEPRAVSLRLVLAATEISTKRLEAR